MPNIVLEVGAINVVCQPHPEGVYLRLFRRIRSLAKVKKIYGDRWGVMSQLWNDGKDPVSQLHGVISTFVQVDVKAPWYNERTEDAADSNDVEKVNIPEYLHPSLRRCGFVFDIATHTLVFETIPRKGGISPRLMLSFFEKLLSNSEIVQEFGSVSLTVIPDKVSVAAILNWKSLRQLIIHAKRPNPGDYDEEDYEEFDQWLKEQGANVLDQALKSESSVIVPNEETRILANIASDNGFVIGKGSGADGRLEERSTKSKKPLFATKKFNTKQMDEQTALLNLADEVVRDIRARRHKRAAKRRAAKKG